MPVRTNPSKKGGGGGAGETKARREDEKPEGLGGLDWAFLASIRLEHASRRTRSLAGRVWRSSAVYSPHPLGLAHRWHTPFTDDDHPDGGSHASLMVPGSQPKEREERETSPACCHAVFSRLRLSRLILSKEEGSRFLRDLSHRGRKRLPPNALDLRTCPHRSQSLLLFLLSSCNSVRSRFSSPSLVAPDFRADRPGQTRALARHS